MVPNTRSALTLFLVLTASLLQLSATPQTESAGPEGVSSEAAASLNRKISRILAAERDADRLPSAESLRVSDEELESFVLYSMRDEIVPRVDSIDVDLEPGVISAVADLYFDGSLQSGNPLIDMLARGSHSLFLEGTLVAHGGEGQFELRAVRVDGVPVPLFFVDALVDRYVTPEHPQVDIEKPFRVPWGVEEIALTAGSATISY